MSAVGAVLVSHRVRNFNQKLFDGLGQIDCAGRGQRHTFAPRFPTGTGQDDQIGITQFCGRGSGGAQSREGRSAGTMSCTFAVFSSIRVANSVIIGEVVATASELDVAVDWLVDGCVQPSTMVSSSSTRFL